MHGALEDRIFFPGPKNIHMPQNALCIFFSAKPWFPYESPARAPREPAGPEDFVYSSTSKKNTRPKMHRVYLFPARKNMHDAPEDRVYSFPARLFYTRRTRGPCIFFPGPTFYTRRTGGLCIFFPGTIFFYKYAKSTKKQ